MKKILATLVVLTMIFTFVSCADGISTSTDINNTNITTNDPIRVGMDLKYPPFETVTLTGEPEGISVDIAMAFGEYIGREVIIVNTDFSTIIPALQSGDIDIAIASMSITEEREEVVDFTDPYFYFKIISLLNKQFALDNSLTEDSTIEDVLALDNVNYIGIATQVSTSIPESYGKTVISATDLGTAVESVAQGTADILLMSANPVVDGYNANPDTTMVLWDAFVSSPIGMAVKEGNSELLAQANAFIDTFNETDGLYDALSIKWDSVILEDLGRYGLDFYINQ